MNKLEILAITFALFTVGTVWAVRVWKKPTSVEPDPGPILPRYDYEDPDPPTMPMAKLTPFVDEIRRAERNRGRAEGRAEALAEKAERPPWMKPLHPARQGRRNRTEQGAPSQRVGDRRVVHPDRNVE